MLHCAAPPAPELRGPAAPPAAARATRSCGWTRLPPRARSGSLGAPPGDARLSRGKSQKYDPLADPRYSLDRDDAPAADDDDDDDEDEE